MSKNEYVKNANSRSPEKKHKVKRNLESNFEEIPEKMTSQNSNKMSEKNLKLFESHFSEESIRFRTKHCSTYSSKFLELFPENFIRTEIVARDLPSLTFVHKIGSMQDLVTFESK